MIPKKIHYCWFGRGNKPKLAQRCINSWKKYCPDYEIIEWNEDSFPIDTNSYTKMCYEQRKYAFLSDYVRLVVVEKYGGIYFDTDVELVKSPDELLNNLSYIGFETKSYVNTGMGFGAVAHSETVKAMLKEYDYLLDGTHGVIGCPQLNTKALVKLGMAKNGEKQELPCGTVYPIDWFNPFDAPTGWLNKTKNTVSIHWYSGGGVSKASYIRSKLLRPLHRLQRRLKGDKNE